MEHLDVLKSQYKKPKYDGSKIDYSHRIITNLGQFFESDKKLINSYNEITSMLVYGNFFEINNENFENFSHLEYLDVSNMTWQKYTNKFDYILRSINKQSPISCGQTDLLQLNKLKKLRGLRVKVLYQNCYEHRKYLTPWEEPDYSWINFLPEGLEELVIDGICATSIKIIKLDNLPTTIKTIKLNKFQLASKKIIGELIEKVKLIKIPMGAKVYVSGEKLNL